jgi:hypothetical protein
MLVTDQTDAQLTDAQWQIADAIARQMVLDGADLNELRKAMAYLREIVSKENAGKQFFDYLKTLVRHGNTIGHSKRTVDYYRSLDAICTQYLTDYQGDAPKMLFLLGWAARLVKYYKEGVPTGELTVPEIKSERKVELMAIAMANSFKIGQQLDAVVATINKTKVTYETIGKVRLSNNEHKLLKANLLSEGQTLKVEVIELRDDGTIKKIKPII